MAELGPHDVKERPDAFGCHPGIEEVAFDAKRFQRMGLLPDQPPRNRGSVHIVCRDIGGVPALTCCNKTAEASSHRDIVACEAPDRLATESGVFIKGVERHAARLHQWRHRGYRRPSSLYLPEQRAK